MVKKSLVVIGLLTLVCSVALLKLARHVQFMPVAASDEAVMIDHAFEGMLKVTIPIFSLILATLLYCLYAFRARTPTEEGVTLHGSKGGLVEVLWVSASLILTLGLAAFGAKEFRLIRGSDHADLDIQVNASQFSWEFFYPSYGAYGSRLILPKDRRVRLLLTSKDVVHSFWVPEFRLKQDALPGKVVKLLLTPSKTGTYQLFCAELCGREHTEMTARVEVVEADQLEKAMKGEAWEPPGT